MTGVLVLATSALSKLYHAIFSSDSGFRTPGTPLVIYFLALPFLFVIYSLLVRYRRNMSPTHGALSMTTDSKKERPFGGRGLLIILVVRVCADLDILRMASRRVHLSFSRVLSPFAHGN